MRWNVPAEHDYRQCDYSSIGVPEGRLVGLRCPRVDAFDIARIDVLRNTSSSVDVFR